MDRRRLRSAVLAAALLAPGGALLAAEEGRAVLRTTDGAEVGTVSLRPAGFGGLILTLQATGIPPGVHGFHLHETGACDAATGFDSAGGHLNPTGHAHGWLSPMGPHLGDLPNIFVPENGELTVEFFVPTVSLGPVADAHSLTAGDGTAVMVHSGADDYTSDPGGNAGKRFACGVIERLE
ncbi:MAG: superoxide dismutase family protein [Geminicoccaceae bacterium]